MRNPKLIPQSVIFGIAALLFTVIWVSGGWAGQEAFTVARLDICTGVENRTPVGVGTAFAADTEMLYAFVDARDIREDTTASFVWFHEDKEVARVPVTLGQGDRWRTHSSKRLGGRSGAWRVEIHDARNTVLATAGFTLN